jgi:hypothetical protein
MRFARRLAFSVLLLLVPALASGQPGEQCRVEFIQSVRPLNVATFFTWYHSEDLFECMSARPKEGWFVSSDMRRTKQHFRRLRKHGFDAIMPVIYADPTLRGAGGGAGDMRKMLKALEIARQQKLQFIPLFDLAIAAHHQERFCNPFAGTCPPDTVAVDSYNFDNHPELERLTVEMVTMIGREFILPFTHPKRPKKSTARHLTDEKGELVLDENGRPRPEIYLYIARAWADNSGGYKTIRVTVRKIKRAFHKMGLGTPAFTLDVVQASGELFDERLVAAFGDTVVGITSFFEPAPSVDNLGDLSRSVHGPMFRAAAEKLGRSIATGLISPRTQVSAGTAPNFDKRKWAQCNGGFGDLAWPARGPEDIFEAFLTSIAVTARPDSECPHLAETGELPFPYRNKRFVYADEGYESTWLCAETENGQFVYPNRYGCQPLHIFEQLTRSLGELR